MPSMTAWRQKKEGEGHQALGKRGKKDKKRESTRREDRFEKYAARIKRGSDTDKSGVVGAAMRRP